MVPRNGFFQVLSTSTIIYDIRRIVDLHGMAFEDMTDFIFSLFFLKQYIISLDTELAQMYSFSYIYLPEAQNKQILTFF